MASTPAARLREIRLSLRAARETRATLPDSASTAERTALRTHITALDLAFTQAGTAALTATGAAVEQAYTAAVAAREAVEQALQGAQATAEKIRLVGKTVGTVGKLINKATGH
jgi:hypothetical protein